MSSETSHGGGGYDALVLGAPGASSKWRSLERRVLLNKIESLEHRARRLEDLERRLRELSSELGVLRRLREATEAIHESENRGQLLEVAASRAAALLGARSGSLQLLDRQTNELVVVRAWGRPPLPPTGARQAVGCGVAGYVARHCEPLLVADIASDGRFPPRETTRYLTGAFLSVPLKNEGEVQGVLNLSDRPAGRSFEPSDLRVAVALGRAVASSLERVRRLEATDEFRRQFVAKLAHELRNPLDGVMRFINLTLSDHHPAERQRRYLLASKQGLERLSGIVEGLAGLGRQALPSQEPVDANEMVRQAVLLQEGKAQERGVEVELDLEEGLPPVLGGQALFQVFTNLASNAYDAMEGRGGRLKITSRRQGWNKIIVRVSDTGPGMPPEMIERVFLPFFTTKGPGKGMGLGLAVCRELVGRLCGRIEVDSVPGRGTTFTVTVPCVPAREVATHQKTES